MRLGGRVLSIRTVILALAVGCVVLVVVLLFGARQGEHGETTAQKPGPPPWGTVPPPKSGAEGVRRSPTVEIKTLITENVPGIGLLELRSRSRLIESPWRVDAEYVYSFRWTPPGQSAREYRICGPGGNIMHSGVELRTTKDQTRFRLVDPESESDFDDPKTGKPIMGLVYCTLDTRTGEFLDLNGVPIDPKLPLEKQEAAGVDRMGDQTYPDWATADGGVLLGKTEH